MKAILNGKLFDRKSVEVICFIRNDFFIEEICKTKTGDYIFVNYSFLEGGLINNITYLRYLTIKELILWYEDIQKKGYEIHKKDRFFSEVEGKLEHI